MSDVREQITLEEVVARYDIVEATNDYAVVAPKQLSDPSVSVSELGHTGKTTWGSYLRDEYNPELRGTHGLMTYDKMRKGDGQVRAALRLIKTPVTAARWYVDSASASKKDQKIAEFVSNCLFKWQTASFPQMLTEALLMLDFGWYSFEKVFEKHDGMVRWKKFAPRHPLDLSTWEFDGNGGPKGMRFYAPNGMEDVLIPIDKLLVFTFDKEAGNMEGISVLRSVYKHWYFKENLYKIDAIQKERHGIGIPLIKLPMQYSAADKLTADELGRNLRTNEKAHVVLPPGWEIAMLKLEGQPVDCMVSVEHHNKMIVQNVLAGFMARNISPNVQDEQMFLKGTRFIAEIVRDTFNKYAIPQLVAYNWGPNVDAPELKFRRLGESIDLRTVSFAARNLVGAGLLTPDEPTEAWFREEMDMPRADPSTARQIATPQMPGGNGQNPGESGQNVPNNGQNSPNSPKNGAQPPKVGPPRQSTAQGSQQGKNAGSNGRVGQDKSGG